MSHSSTAKLVRLDKERHSEKYCRDARCLWRTGGKFGTPCRNHPPACPSCGDRRPWLCVDNAWEDRHERCGKHWHCPDCGHTWDVASNNASDAPGEAPNSA